VLKSRDDGSQVLEKSLTRWPPWHLVAKVREIDDRAIG
jgi:hypothetical protein